MKKLYTQDKKLTQVTGQVIFLSIF